MLAIPARTPIPPAPTTFEKEPTPAPKTSRNTTSASVRMTPCPT